MPQLKRSIVVKGKVQGVFFRASTVTKAHELKLEGWVKNLPTGEVEIFAYGPEDAMISLIAWCHHGSKYSKVSKVLVSESNEEIPKDFKIIY